MIHEVPLDVYPELYVLLFGSLAAKDPHAN
jgi:hypothetical protein